MIFLMSSCKSLESSGSAPIHDVCIVDKPISWSPADTLETRDQVIKYNLSHKDLCKWW